MTSPATSSPRWEIKALHTDLLPGPLEIGPDGLTIGRDPSNTIVVPSEDFPGVSSHHARVVRRDGEIVVEDLNSKNGTYVAGKPIQHHVVRHGDIIELGRGGLRLAILCDSAVHETATLSGGEPLPRVRRAIGADTIRLVRQKLGLPEEGGLEQLLARRTFTERRVITTVALLLVAGCALAYWLVDRQTDTSEARIHALTSQLEELLSQKLDEVQTRFDSESQVWMQWSERWQEAQAAWESERGQLENHQADLERQLQQMLVDEQASVQSLSRLRESLSETSARLELFNPINLEKNRLREVERVEHSVVLVEARLRFLEERTGRSLSIERGEDGELEPNFEGRGQPLIKESTGSGFCFSPDGWILTNAHVVHKKGEGNELSLGPDLTLISEVQVRVVFSASSERHDARLVQWVADGDDDLALLQIEPFEGMPSLPGIDVNTPRPPPGSEVYLIGFPLGKSALRQGENLVASTFRGIVSRQLETYLQVDAAVHPGASGGPLIDGTGRVLGVVVGMQAVDEVAGSSNIGYIIPISKARAVHPDLMVE